MAIDEFQKDVIDRLGRIETKLDNDYHALHGNGKPGLLDRVSHLENQAALIEVQQAVINELTTRVTELDSRFQALSVRMDTDKNWFTRIRDSLGWLVATAIAIYGAFFK
jgi:uncharacterized coiled-coil protein SlyX